MLFSKLNIGSRHKIAPYISRRYYPSEDIATNCLVFRKRKTTGAMGNVVEAEVKLMDSLGQFLTDTIWIKIDQIGDNWSITDEELTLNKEKQEQYKQRRNKETELKDSISKMSVEELNQLAEQLKSKEIEEEINKM